MLANSDLKGGNKLYAQQSTLFRDSTTIGKSSYKSKMTKSFTNSKALRSNKRNRKNVV